MKTLTLKEINERVETTKTKSGWYHEFRINGLLFYTIINRFDPSQTCRVYTETGKTYEMYENTKKEFIHSLYRNQDDFLD